MTYQNSGFLIVRKERFIQVERNGSNSGPLFTFGSGRMATALPNARVSQIVKAQLLEPANRASSGVLYVMER